MREREEDRPLELVTVVVGLDEVLALATNVDDVGFTDERGQNVRLVEIEVGGDLLVGGVADLIGERGGVEEVRRVRLEDLSDAQEEGETAAIGRRKYGGNQIVFLDEVIERLLMLQ